LFPPKSPEQASAADSLKNFSSPVARLAAFPVFFDYPTSDISKGQNAPCGFAAGVTQNVVLCGASGKQRINFPCVKVTTL